MEDIPQHQERGLFNARTDFEAVKRAIAEVERGGWLSGEERIAARWDDAPDGERSNSLEGARRWLATVDPSERQDAFRVVYGDGGIDRWYIYADGAVRFSKFHAFPESLKRATEKGFWIE